MAAEEKTRKELTLESIVEGKKMEAYVEHRTKEMHTCAICGCIGYKKWPMRSVGGRWFCMDCVRQLKDLMDNLDKWEAEVKLESELSKRIDEGLGL